MKNESFHHFEEETKESSKDLIDKNIDVLLNPEQENSFSLQEFYRQFLGQEPDYKKAMEERNRIDEKISGLEQTMFSFLINDIQPELKNLTPGVNKDFVEKELLEMIQKNLFIYIFTPDQKNIPSKNQEFIDLFWQYSNKFTSMFSGQDWEDFNKFREELSNIKYHKEIEEKNEEEKRQKRNKMILESIEKSKYSNIFSQIYSDPNERAEYCNKNCYQLKEFINQIGSLKIYLEKPEKDYPKLQGKIIDFFQTFCSSKNIETSFKNWINFQKIL